MKNMYQKRVFAGLVSVFTMILCQAQLSGTYTVGGYNPDFTTPQTAADRLVSAGVSGNVIFNIRAGHYAPVLIDSFQAATSLYTVIFEAENHDSNSVVLSGYTPVDISSGAGVTFKWLTLIASADQAVSIYSGYKCAVTNCLIQAPNSAGTSEQQMAVNIHHSWQPPNSSVTISNCSITGTAGGILVEGQNGSTTLSNNSVNCTGYYNMYLSWVNLFTATANYFGGQVYMFSTTGNLFNNNIVAGQANVSRFSVVKGNVFNGSSLEVEAAITDNNIVNCDFTSHYSPQSTFSNNLFNGNADIGYETSSLVSHNICKGQFSFEYGDGSAFTNNEFRQWTECGYSQGSIFYNNIFYNSFGIAFCPNTRVYYNNFSGTQNFNWTTDYPDIRYNNFSAEPQILGGGTVTGNNYYNCIGYLDAHPYHYAPQYISDSNARSQNLLLAGKGSRFNYLSVDIDGKVRGIHPTIGANEICAGSLHQYDSITLTCGDSLHFNFCNPDSGYHWTPGYGLADSTASATVAGPLVTTLYYLLDSTGAAIDSALIIVNNFIPDEIPADSLSCSYNMSILYGNYSPGATYLWTPATGLSDSTINNPWVSCTATTTYIQQISIPGCGLYYDTTTVFYNPSPIASIGYAEDTGYSYAFYNWSYCADSFTWYFGDGHFSDTAGNPDTPFLHSYPTPGTYTVTLIACNSYACDTETVSIIVYPNVVANINEGTLTLAPNPFSDNLKISGYPPNAEINMYDITGRLVYTAHCGSTSSLTIEPAPLANGLYLLEIKSGSNRFVKQLVKYSE